MWGVGGEKGAEEIRGDRVSFFVFRDFVRSDRMKMGTWTDQSSRVKPMTKNFGSQAPSFQDGFV